MVIFILRRILILLPGVPVQFPQMLRAGIYHQVTPLLDPAQLQLNPVQNFQFFVGVAEVVQASMQALVLA